LDPALSSANTEYTSIGDEDGGGCGGAGNVTLHYINSKKFSIRNPVLEVFWIVECRALGNVTLTGVIRARLELVFAARELSMFYLGFYEQGGDLAVGMSGLGVPATGIVFPGD
jgi:hypothetical protein